MQKILTKVRVLLWIGHLSEWPDAQLADACAVQADRADAMAADLHLVLRGVAQPCHPLDGALVTGR
ncbi:MAG: hypothetical protein AAGC76_05390 [Luteibacter sp.]|uniref:hypothetical protein n=1 Tax=Luteibacter sp. TaxID=1886636 RepID=UPI002807B3D2|nr:hypothetical protein [Luteibacter sp.]MDQ7995271.1 hypothetical protein [Luteibacter sp.]